MADDTYDHRDRALEILSEAEGQARDRGDDGALMAAATVEAILALDDTLEEIRDALRLITSRMA